MDYTMDEGQPGQNPPQSHQCQYQLPHQSPNSNTYSPPSRDAHHYDPVHNTDSWYQNNGPGAQSRPQYTATQNLSQWNPGQYIPISSWQGFGEAQGGTQGHDGPGYRQQNGFMGISNTPWSEMRGYEPLPFGYHNNGYAGSGNGPSAEQNPPRRSSLTASTQIPASQTQQPSLAALQAEYVRRSTHRGTHSESILERAHPEYASRMRESDRMAGRMRDETPASQSQPPRSHAYGARPGRRHLAGWDSDEDDEPVPAVEIDSSYRRSSEILFADMDDERHMAAVRGAIAAGKKVPSKDFVASLEKLDPKDLEETDRTCMICYNELGVQNPDGVLEHPIRLPKCKHVFGDKCIKKWFEDSDSCPYCRDKLPSELSVRKSIALEALQQARRERLQAVAAASQGHGFIRSRHGFGSVRFPSEEHANTGLSRHNQEEYHHYIMRGSMPPDPWSQSPPNRSSPREPPEYRRRQPRGRAGIGRPTSVGSARFISPNMNHQNAPRAHLQNITPNFHGATSPPRRSITPGLPRHNATGSSGSSGSIAHSTVQTPPRNSRLPGPSSSLEEASPPVAVGSGIAAGERQAPPMSLLNRPSSLSEYANSQWSDPFGAFLNQAEPTYFRPARPADLRAHVAETGDLPLFEAGPTNSDLPQIPMGDVSLPPRDMTWNEGMVPRWSR